MYKLNNAVREQISEAVDQIDSFVTNEMREKQGRPGGNHTGQKLPPEKRGSHEDPREHEEKKRRLLWFGVICLMLIVLIMWGLNTQLSFYALRSSHEQNTVSTKAQETYEDILTLVNGGEENDLLNAIAKEQKKQETETPSEQLRSSVKELLRAFAATSPSSTVSSTTTINTQTNEPATTEQTP